MELRLREADQGWSTVMKLLQKYLSMNAIVDVIVKINRKMGVVGCMGQYTCG